MAWISVGVLGPRSRGGVISRPRMTVWMHNPNHEANVAARKLPSLPFHFVAKREWKPVEFLPAWPYHRPPAEELPA